MMYLASRPVGELFSLREVSREQNIPQGFLAKIFQNLVHAGLVVSKQGACGGFGLARPGSQITVAEVMQAIDGPLALNRCVTWPEICERSERCTMHARKTIMLTICDAAKQPVAADGAVRRC